MVSSVLCTDAWPSSGGMCSSLPPTARYSFVQVRRNGGGHSHDTGRCAVSLEQCQRTVSLRAPALVFAPPRLIVRNTCISAGGSRSPWFDLRLHPCRHRTVRTCPCFDQIHNAPSPVPLLDIARVERHHLRPTQPAAQE